MSFSTDSLQQRVSELEDELEEKTENLRKAAEFGKTLLSTNQLLNDKLEAGEAEHSKQLENLEQEKYSLKMKVECLESSVSNLQQELDGTLAQLDQVNATHAKRLAEVHSKTISNLAAINEDLKAEIGKLNLQHNTTLEKLKKKEEIIEGLREELSAQGSSSMLQNELVDLEALYANEKSRCERLEMDMLEEEGRAKVAEMDVASLQQKVATLEEECEDRNRMAKEWYDDLQLAKDHSAELSSQLELLKSQRMEGVNGNQTQTTGNSLFGEVDDRRVNIERRMITIRVKHESLERTHATTVLQLKKMKAEMSSLLCQYSATSADVDHVKRLQRALTQSKSELQSMAAKLHRLERQQAKGVAVQDIKDYMTAFVDLGDKAEYIHLLEHELEQERKCHGSVVKELDLKRTQLLWETNKLREAETKLHHSQREQAKLRLDHNKLQLRLQEARDELNQAKSLCEQHKAEKQYLEEELKNKRSSRLKPDTAKERVPTSSSNVRDLPAGSEESGTKSSGLPGPALSSTESKPTVLKDVNILDDLEKEFSKVYGRGVLDYHSKQLLGGTQQQTGKSSDIKTQENVIKQTEYPPLKTVNSCPQQ